MEAWDNVILLRKTANMLFAFSVLAALYGAIHYIVHLPELFPLHSVRLNAAPQRIIPQDVLQAVRSEVNGNFFTVDIERFRQSLEKLPWVRSVNIRREFPDRLAVHFEEHQALARWNDSARFDPSTMPSVLSSVEGSGQAASTGSGQAASTGSGHATSTGSGHALLRTELVNLQGEVFNAGRNTLTPKSTGTGESVQALPGFVGHAGDSREIAQRYAQFNNQLGALNLQVSQIALSPRHAWQLRLSNGMVVELGREEMQQRLARFVAAYPSLAGQEGTLKYVDMRYRNGFAVGGMVKG